MKKIHKNEILAAYISARDSAEKRQKERDTIYDLSPKELKRLAAEGNIHALTRIALTDSDFMPQDSNFLGISINNDSFITPEDAKNAEKKCQELSDSTDREFTDRFLAFFNLADKWNHSYVTAEQGNDRIGIMKVFKPLFEGNYAETPSPSDFIISEYEGQIADHMNEYGEDILRFYLNEAKSGRCTAILNVADCLANGWGTEPDPEESERWEELGLAVNSGEVSELQDQKPQRLY